MEAEDKVTTDIIIDHFLENINSDILQNAYDIKRVPTFTGSSVRDYPTTFQKTENYKNILAANLEDLGDKEEFNSEKIKNSYRSTDKISSMNVYRILQAIMSLFTRVRYCESRWYNKTRTELVLIDQKKHLIVFKDKIKKASLEKKNIQIPELYEKEFTVYIRSNFNKEVYYEKIRNVYPAYNYGILGGDNSHDSIYDPYYAFNGDHDNFSYYHNYHDILTPTWDHALTVSQNHILTIYLKSPVVLNRINKHAGIWTIVEDDCNVARIVDNLFIYCSIGHCFYKVNMRTGTWSKHSGYNTTNVNVTNRPFYQFKVKFSNKELIEHPELIQQEITYDIQYIQEEHENLIKDIEIPQDIAEKKIMTDRIKEIYTSLLNEWKKIAEDEKVVCTFYTCHVNCFNTPPIYCHNSRSRR